MNWIIAQLERNSANNGVTVAHWTVNKIEGDNFASSYGTVGFTPDPDAEGFVDFDSLTEEMVLEWVKDSINVEEIEAGLDLQLAEMASSSVIAGMPWNDA